MSNFDRSSLKDSELLRGCREHLADEAKHLAAVLADLAEIRERKLYRPAACSSLRVFCVQELGMSEDAAAKRVQVARIVRQFPTVLEGIATRRLSLGTARLLAPHLTPENAAELIEQASGKTCEAVRLMLAQRFPKPNVETSIARLPATTCDDEHATWHVPVTSTGQSQEFKLDAPAPANAPQAPHTKVAPLAPERYELRATMDQETYDDARAILNMLGYGEDADVMKAFKSAAKLMRAQLEKKHHAATDRPGKRRASSDTRYVPADVQRAVRKRDGYQCTFKSASGKRCEERRHMQFDHIVPFARGGRSTFENLRLRCPAHNQLEAENTLGAGFMAEKRAGAKAAREQAARAKKAEPGKPTEPEREQRAAEAAQLKTVVNALRHLGLTTIEAKLIASATAAHGRGLEEHVRLAVRSIPQKCTRVPAPSEAA